jgi:hypothetical protein
MCFAYCIPSTKSQTGSEHLADIAPMAILLPATREPIIPNLPCQKLIRSTNLPNAPHLLFKDGISTLTNCLADTGAGLMFALDVKFLVFP